MSQKMYPSLQDFSDFMERLSIKQGISVKILFSKYISPVFMLLDAMNKKGCSTKKIHICFAINVYVANCR